MTFWGGLLLQVGIKRRDALEIEDFELDILWAEFPCCAQESLVEGIFS
jgi:hypothetical protein